MNYMWRMFIPTLLLVWGAIAIMLANQYRRERQYKMENIRVQLELINDRVIDTYENGIEIRPFMDFLDRMYNHTIFDDVRISVYDQDHDRLMYNLGRPISRKEAAASDIIETTYEIDFLHHVEEEEVTMSYLNVNTESPDRKIIVISAIPIEPALAATEVGPGLWMFVLALVAATFLIAYLTTRLLTRNITLMRDFANKAAAGEPIPDIAEFPHDELGDISRQIVKLYEDRNEDRRRRELEHKIALHAIEEKSRMKRQLTNNINHELKTPIGIIKGYLDTILADSSMDSATKHHFLTRARANVDRLVSMMNDVSTMTRLEDGSENITLAEVELHDIVYTISNDYEKADLGEQNKLQFIYDIPLNCHVLANATLINSMLLNLMKNASIHSKGSWMKLAMVDENDDFYTFSFCDNGVGVAPESIPFLFERFYRIDEGRSRKAGGTGLGLPIVRKIVIAMGGAISVKNRAAGGLEFIFTLPKWDSRRKKRYRSNRQQSQE